MSSGKGRSGRPVGQGRKVRPRLEVLEDRSLLSVCLADRLTDLGEGKDFVGDLRYCVTEAQDEDSIQFLVKGTINLTRALPDLTRSISIEGPGADLLTVRRNTGGDYRIFTVGSSATVRLSGLTISNGFTFGQTGGGISNSGTLTISNSTISRNSAFEGGGIFNSGTLVVNYSTLTGNTGAGLFFTFGGGISIRGTLAVSNSTISRNGAGS